MSPHSHYSIIIKAPSHIRCEKALVFVLVSMIWRRVYENRLRLHVSKTEAMGKFFEDDSLYLGAETLRCAEQVTRIGDDFLGLLQCTQVEERDFEAGFIILDALEKRMTDGRNVALEGVAFYEELIALREVVLIDTLLYSFEKVVSALDDGGVFFDVSGRKRVEVVVYVFENRF